MEGEWYVPLRGQRSYRAGHYPDENSAVWVAYNLAAMGVDRSEIAVVGPDGEVEFEWDDTIVDGLRGWQLTDEQMRSGQ